MNDTEKHRAQCEARYWLKTIGSNKGRFDALMARIEKRRGIAAARRLGDDMRTEYRIQRDAAK